MSRMTASTIRVVAPADLDEDYCFDVVVEGKPFTVTVPPGGVREGQEFEIPYGGDAMSLDKGKNRSSYSKNRESNSQKRYDDDEDSYLNGDEIEVHDAKKEKNKKSQTKGTADDESYDEESNEEKSCPTSNAMSEMSSGAVHGRWRNRLFSCCDVITQATFWVSIFCVPVLMAQLVTRLRLNSMGRRTDSESEISLSFNKIILTFLTVLFIGNILPGIGLAFVAAYMLYVVIFIGKNVRFSMRQLYGIPPTLHNKLNYCEDCVCMSFCGFCSMIQMARHTHNDKEFPGYCCTTTGLEAGAPEIMKR